MQSSDLMVVYYVLDMERAHGFYTRAVGLEPKEYSPYWSELSCGETTVALHILDKGSQRGLTQVPTINLRVDKLEPAIEKVVATGGTLLSKREAEPYIPVRLAELKDTEGNLFEFRQDV
jgi:predicted enzyme related to lactoylglutathione lyase